MSGSSSLLSFLLGKGETTNPTIPFYFLCSPPHSARFLYPQIKLVGHPQSCEGYPASSCWNSSSWHSKVTKLERFWGYGWVSWPSGTVQCCRLLWFLWGIIMIIRIKQPTFSVIFVWATLEANPCLRPQPHWVLVYSRKWLGVILWAVLLFFKFIGLYQPPQNVPWSSQACSADLSLLPGHTSIKKFLQVMHDIKLTEWWYHNSTKPFWSFPR